LLFPGGALPVTESDWPLIAVASGMQCAIRKTVQAGYGPDFRITPGTQGKPLRQIKNGAV